MAAIHRLKTFEVSKLIRPGLHADGGGLYLNIGRNGARSWIFRFTLAGRTRDMGLGSANTISVADARHKAQEARKQLADGVDPIEARATALESRRVEAAKAITFDQCVEALIATRRAGWKNAKHAEQWRSTLATYASPKIGKLPVQMIDTARVMEVLRPIWATKPETARRVRGRIEAVLASAKVLGYRSGDNPAQWRNHLDQLLPPRSKVRGVVHHAALPYQELPAFMARLYCREGTAARALIFTILTAARTNEVIGARWNEIDWDRRIWMIPAARMKGDREGGEDHRVPLSEAVITLLKAAGDNPNRDDHFIFPGGNRRARHVSNMAMLALLGRMGFGSLTVHGFRSSFRTWAAECTDSPREIAEKALGHVIGDETERAYQRGDLLEKRRKLVQAWNEFCVGPARPSVKLKAGNVINYATAAQS
jgi:integrase